MATALPDYPDSDFSDEDLSPLEITFNLATGHIRKITSKLNENQLLELYGLYKQGTEGKCNIPKPSWFSVQARHKWEAWRAVGDISQEEAKQKYINLVRQFDPEFADIFDNPRSQNNKLKETWVTVSSLRYSPEPDLISQDLSILDAAREDCAERITELLLEKPELKHEKGDGGLTALHWAADRDATKALVAAINGGCEIDAVDDCGETALHYAVSCGHVASTKILIEAGASPFVKNDEGIAPTDIASDGEIKLLLESAIK